MLPAVLDMLIALAGLAIGLLVRDLWTIERPTKPPHHLSMLYFWRTYPRVVCIGLVVLFVMAVVWKGAFQIREAATVGSIRTQLLGKIEEAERLAKAIPKGCPKGLDHEPWAKKVEDWRTETDRILVKRIPGFAADRGDYPHRPGCLIEWVRNRLDYFASKAQAANLALGAR